MLSQPTQLLVGERGIDERACGCPEWVLAHAHFDSEVLTLGSRALCTNGPHQWEGEDFCVGLGVEFQPCRCHGQISRPLPRAVFPFADLPSAEAEFRNQADLLLGRKG